MVKIVDNYSYTRAEPESCENKEIESELETDYESIIRKAQENSKCNVPYESIPIKGEPVEIQTDPTENNYIDYDNPCQDEFFSLSSEIVEKCNKIDDKISQVTEIIPEEEKNGDSDDNYYAKKDKIMFPIHKIERNITLMNKKLKVISYVTICQMYSGILVNDKLSIRKGKAYEYKHHNEIYINSFFRIIYQHRKEVYDRLGYEKALLIEEIFNRLFETKVFIKEEKENGVLYLKSKDSFREEDEFDEETLSEMNRIRDTRIKFKNPIRIRNRETRYNTYSNLIIKGIHVSNDGVEFYGCNESIDDSGSIAKTLELNDDEYNYLYKFYETIIKNVICKLEYLYNKVFLLKIEHCTAIEEKCKKYLLVASLNQIKIKDYLER